MEANMEVSIEFLLQVIGEEVVKNRVLTEKVEELKSLIKVDNGETP